MSTDIPESRRGGSSSFQKVVDAFLCGEGLPFSSILSAERIEGIFAKHDCLFGRHGVYTAATAKQDTDPGDSMQNKTQTPGTGNG